MENSALHSYLYPPDGVVVDLGDELARLMRGGCTIEMRPVNNLGVLHIAIMIKPPAETPAHGLGNEVAAVAQGKRPSSPVVSVLYFAWGKDRAHALARCFRRARVFLGVR